MGHLLSASIADPTAGIQHVEFLARLGSWEVCDRFDMQTKSGAPLLGSVRDREKAGFGRCEGGQPAFLLSSGWREREISKPGLICLISWTF